MITFLISQKIPIYESPAQFISSSETLEYELAIAKCIHTNQKLTGKPRAPGDLRHPSRINYRRRSTTSHQFQHRRFSGRKKKVTNNVHLTPKKKKSTKRK